MNRLGDGNGGMWNEGAEAGRPGETPASGSARQTGATKTFRFAEFTCVASECVLVRGGRHVPIAKQSFDVLVQLLDAAGRLVSRNALLQGAWNGATVSNGAIHQAVLLLRKTLKNAGGSETIIETVRGRGFRVAVPVESHAVPRLSSRSTQEGDGELLQQAPRFHENHPLGDSACRGRDRELRLVETSAGEALQGRAQCILIGGEPGIGKSVLLGATARRLTLVGFRVLQGAAREDGASIPFWPWREIVRFLHACGPEVGIDGPDIANLALMLFPLQDAQYPHLVEPDQAADAREAAFRGFERLVKGVAAQSPLALLFDDLHAADSASLELLTHVLMSIEDSRLAIIGTFRTTEGPGIGSSPLGGMPHLPAGHRIILKGLDRAACADLLERRLGMPPSSGDVDQILALTEGSPFLLESAAQAIAAGSTVDDLVTKMDVGDRARVAASRSIADLPAETLELLRVASVMGRDVNLRLLAEVCGEGLHATMTVATPAFARGLLLPRGTFRASFSHALIRRALYEAMPPIDRRRWHFTVAIRIHQYRGAQADAFGECAHHAWLGATTAEEARFAATVLAHAARSAFGATAFEESHLLAGRAIDMLNRDQTRNEQLWAELSIQRAAALHGAGRLEEAIEVYAQVAEWAMQSRANTAMVEATLGYSAAQKGFADRRLIGYLQHTIAECGPHPARVEGALLGELALALRLTPALAEGRASAQRALARARALEDDKVLARALFGLRWNIDGEESPGELLQMSQRAIELTRALGDRALVLEHSGWMLGDLLESGDRAGFDRELQIFRAAAEERRQPWLAALVARYSLVGLLMDGELAEADAQIEHVAALGRACGDALTVPVWCVESISVRHERGGGEALVDVCRQLDALMPGIPNWRAVLCFALASTGRFDEAREELEAVGPELNKSRLSFSYGAAVAVASEAAYLVKAPAIAAILRSRMLRLGRRHVVSPSGSAYLGPLSRYIGLAYLVEGDRQEAKCHFEHALAEAVSMRAGYYAARAKFELAQCLTERSQARELVEEAHGEATRLGAQRLQSEIESVFPGIAGMRSAVG